MLQFKSNKDTLCAPICFTATRPDLDALITVFHRCNIYSGEELLVGDDEGVLYSLINSEIFLRKELGSSIVCIGSCFVHSIGSRFNFEMPEDTTLHNEIVVGMADGSLIGLTTFLDSKWKVRMEGSVRCLLSVEMIEEKEGCTYLLVCDSRLQIAPLLNTAIFGDSDGYIYTITYSNGLYTTHLYASVGFYISKILTRNEYVFVSGHFPYLLIYFRGILEQKVEVSDWIFDFDIKGELLEMATLDNQLTRYDIKEY